MAHDPKDISGLRHVRVELSKRGIDTSRADVRVMHGICSIKGVIVATKDATFADVRTEMEHIRVILRQRQEIKDVVLDCIYR